MKAHESVMSWVTGELSSGRLRIGDRLPGERTLAETLGVSRSSIREALRVLEALGAVTSARGSGPRSGTIISAAPEQALALALNLQLATSQAGPAHVFETRLLLEEWAAKRSRPASGDWNAAERLLDRMDDEDLSVDEFLALDAEFHAMISRAAGNPLISTLMEGLRLSIADHTAELSRSLPDWAATAARLRAEHRGILEALRSGAGERAAELLHAHIGGYYREAAGE